MADAPRHPMLVRVMAELGAARFTEEWIEDKHIFVNGYTEGKHIWINPAPAVVHTVIHEILHKLKPAWPEAYVEGMATRLLRQLTDREVWAMYLEYHRRVRRPKRRRRHDDDDD